MEFKGTNNAIDRLSTIIDSASGKIDKALADDIKQKLAEAKTLPKADLASVFSEREANMLLELVNPTDKATGKRVFEDSVFAQTSADIADPRKFAITINQRLRGVLAELDKMIVENKKNSTEIERQKDVIEKQQGVINNLDAKINNNQSFLGRVGKYVKSKVAPLVIAGALLLGSLVGNVTLGVKLAKSKEAAADFESRYEYVLAENGRAKDALKMFDYDFDEEKSLDEIVGDVYSGTKAEHKEEVDQAYAMVVKIFADNNIELKDIYNEETGEYDVSKLEGELGTTVKGLMQNTSALQAVEKQVGATLNFIKIAKRDANGQVVLKDGKVDYKTLEDYETLADAIEDIGKNYQASLDREVASLGETVEVALKNAGSPKTMKDFTSVSSAIEYLGSLAKSANDEIARLSGELKERDQAISGLQSQIGELEGKYNELMGVKENLEQKVRDLEDQKSGNKGQEVADKGNGGNTASPVAGEEKDQDNSGGSPRPGQREDGNGGSSSYDEDDMSK